MVATPNFGEIFCKSSRERETRIWQKRVVGLKMNDSGLFQGKNVFVTISTFKMKMKILRLFVEWVWKTKTLKGNEMN